MFPAILVSVACLAGEPGAAPNVGSQSKTIDLTAYEETRAKMGRGPDAHVRMAIWCEAHGLNSERLKHLAIAVLTDPAHATARGLLGLVAFRGQWQSPEAICEKLEADQTASAALAEYNGRRARMGNSADSHWKIAVWCEQQGLKPEATAHLTMVTQLDPHREAAWKRLGYRKQGGRWATAEQLAAEKTEAEAQKKADKRWTTLLAKLRSGLDDKSKQAGAAKTVAGISDPRAVPSVWASLRNRHGVPSIGRSAGLGADRFARLDAGAGAPGPRGQVGRGAEQGDPDTPPPQPARDRVLLGRPPARPGARSRPDPLPL